MIAAKTAVFVHGSDPFIMAGASAMLSGRSDFEVIDKMDESCSQTVHLVVSESLDATVKATLRHLVDSRQKRIILVIDVLRDSEIFHVVESGVDVILWRHEVTPDRLRTAVASAARGERGLPPDLLGRFMSEMGRIRRNQETVAPPILDDRETDILNLLSEGLSTKEIAEKIRYSERTVKGVLHILISRLKVRNRTHAVAFALREGYL